MGPFSDPAGPECGFQRGRERLSKKKQDVRLGTRLTNPSFYSRNENVQRRTDLQSYLGLDRHEVQQDHDMEPILVIRLQDFRRIYTGTRV